MIQNAGVATPSAPVQIVTGLLRDGDRLLLVHRSPQRLHFPDVWDLPGGHVDPGELPAAAVVRELREELGVEVTEPPGPPMTELHISAISMKIWLFETWTGTPANTAPEEHDAIGWFTKDQLGDLVFAHAGFRKMLTQVLTEAPG